MSFGAGAAQIAVQRARWSRSVPVEGEEWVVIRAYDQTPGEECFEDLYLIPYAISQWRRDAVHWAHVLEMYQAAYGFDAAIRRWTERVPWLERRVADAFQQGVLLLVHPVMEKLPGFHKDESAVTLDYLEEHKRKKDAQKKQSLLLPKKTWVEIKLVDQDGVVVPNERYKVTLPDGTIKEGRLDENGWMRESGIDPGTCVITFPDIHYEEWDPE
jgi:hypothetical protein